MGREDVPCVNHAVEIHCRLINLKELWVIEVLGVRTVAAHNHLHSLFKVLDFVPDSMQIEVVGDVFLVNFCKELVTFQVTEPLDPSIATFAVVVVVHVYISVCLFESHSNTYVYKRINC